MNVQELTARDILISSNQLVPLILLLLRQFLKAESPYELRTRVQLEVVDILVISLHNKQAYPSLKVPCDAQIFSNPLVQPRLLHTNKSSACLEELFRFFPDLWQYLRQLGVRQLIVLDRNAFLYIFRSFQEPQTEIIV